jgi:hypothetical protein
MDMDNEANRLPDRRHRGRNPAGDELIDEIRQGKHHDRRPYFKHMHRDWRFWVAVVFIFGALAVYIFSDDLALVPRSPQRPSLSTTQ